MVHSYNTSRHLKTLLKINLPLSVEHWPALIRARAQYDSPITYAETTCCVDRRSRQTCAVFVHHSERNSTIILRQMKPLSRASAPLKATLCIHVTTFHNSCDILNNEFNENLDQYSEAFIARRELCRSLMKKQILKVFPREDHVTRACNEPQ